MGEGCKRSWVQLQVCLGQISWQSLTLLSICYLFIPMQWLHRQHRICVASLRGACHLDQGEDVPLVVYFFTFALCWDLDI